MAGILNFSNFIKRNIYTIFAEKSWPAFSDLFHSDFATALMYLKVILFNNINSQHFWTLQTLRNEISTWPAFSAFFHFCSPFGFRNSSYVSKSYTIQ